MNETEKEEKEGAPAKIAATIYFKRISSICNKQMESMHPVQETLGVGSGGKGWQMESPGRWRALE